MSLAGLGIGRPAIELCGLFGMKYPAAADDPSSCIGLLGARLFR